MSFLFLRFTGRIIILVCASLYIRDVISRFLSGKDSEGGTGSDLGEGVLPGVGGGGGEGTDSEGS